MFKDNFVEKIKRPFPRWPVFERDEIDKVSEILSSGKINYWTGEEGRKFEQEFAEYVGQKYAVALSNGTVALELALKILNIGAGDEVIVPSKSFIASASCVVLQGATPVFADIDPESQTISPQSIKDKITPRTKAIITVHLAGWPCDMNPILKIAEQFNLKIIEDCAQSHGAFYHGKPAGSFGIISAFSFCQDKIMTTGGEGGMLLTSDRDLWEKAWSFKDHGKNYDKAHEKNTSNTFRWIHDSIGTNWRLTELQSALGRIQLKKLDKWVEIRRTNSAHLDRNFMEIPSLRVVKPEKHVKSSYYKYYVFLRPEKLKKDWTKDKIISTINAEGVPCFHGSCSEIYLEKAFTDLYSGKIERLPNAKRTDETCLVFLVHPTLTEADMEYTCQIVRKVMNQAQI